jgi:hypothetical protein
MVENTPFHENNDETTLDLLRTTIIFSSKSTASKQALHVNTHTNKQWLP